jgi:hypothetical protein
MAIFAGAATAAAIVVLGFATRQGAVLSFYSTVLVVIALVYVLFAAMNGTPAVVGIESGIAAGFIAVAIAGARWASPTAAGLLLAGGLGLHGLFDLVHGLVVDNPVVPSWWPAYCAVVDLGVGTWLAVLASRGSLQAPPPARRRGGDAR